MNLSDIAAMAGMPRFATVSLCLPADVTLAFFDGLYDGLLERAAEVGRPRGGRKPLGHRGARSWWTSRCWGRETACCAGRGRGPATWWW